jgi:hypothetical protein
MFNWDDESVEPPYHDCEMTQCPYCSHEPMQLIYG